jgi:hypothetical protein
VGLCPSPSLYEELIQRWVAEDPEDVTGAGLIEFLSERASAGERCDHPGGADAAVHEFLFVALALAIRGATGSMIDPVAIT